MSRMSTRHAVARVTPPPPPTENYRPSLPSPHHQRDSSRAPRTPTFSDFIWSSLDLSLVSCRSTSAIFSLCPDPRARASALSCSYSCCEKKERKNNIKEKAKQNPYCKQKGALGLAKNGRRKQNKSPRCCMCTWSMAHTCSVLSNTLDVATPCRPVTPPPPRPSSPSFRLSLHVTPSCLLSSSTP